MDDLTNRVCKVCKNWKRLKGDTGRCMFSGKKSTFLFTDELSSCQLGFERKK